MYTTLTSGAGMSEPLGVVSFGKGAVRSKQRHQPPRRCGDSSTPAESALYSSPLGSQNRAGVCFDVVQVDFFCLGAADVGEPIVPTYIVVQPTSIYVV